VPRRQARHIERRLTPAEEARVRTTPAQAEAEKEELLTLARRYKMEHDSLAAPLKAALRLLKAERLAQGLSLGAIERATGIGRPALSRLEREADPNPTIGTLARYADALGKRVVIGLEEKE
jgi:hypothetical protein